MNNKITFGKHEGKSFEWLFFHAPWYAEWMYENRIHRDQYKFSEEEGEVFAELYSRASHITGTCQRCKERQITRMGLSTHASGALGAVGLYCDECEYLGGSRTEYYTPSFFVEEHTMPRCEQLRIVDHIKNRFVGGYVRLTQAKMEEFFRNDGRFVNATPRFFTREYAVAMGYD